MTVWYSVDAKLVEPVTMSSGNHSRNQAAAHPFLTGSALRGSLAARWLREQHHVRSGRRPTPIGDRATHKQFMNVFESGAVRFPFLYPPGPPPRLSLFECKATPDHPAADLVDPRHPVGTKVTCRECASALDRGVSGPDDRRRTHVRTRTAVGDDGVAAQALLYAQEELSAGRLFSGIMAVDDDVDLTAWLPVGNEVALRLGADTSTGGTTNVLVTPQSVGPHATTPAARREAWLAAGLATDVVVLTARSPLVLTDRWLRPADRFDHRILGDELGLTTVELVPFTLARSRPAGGWNPAAGIPKPGDVSLVEGSVAQVRVKDDLSDPQVMARLTQAEECGLGWRRAEGFGAVTLWSSIHLSEWRAP